MYNLVDDYDIYYNEFAGYAFSADDIINKANKLTDIVDIDEIGDYLKIKYINNNHQLITIFDNKNKFRFTRKKEK